MLLCMDLTVFYNLIYFAMPNLKIMTDNQNKYKQLREKYPFFSFESFNISEEKYQHTIRFHFSLAGKEHFYPVLMIPKMAAFQQLDDATWNWFAFHIGMVEAISYWKTACPPRFFVKPYHLDENRISWWKKLYFNGLGEFFYQNNIQTHLDEFMHIETGKRPLPKPEVKTSENKILVPVGGGKDSAVTLELLKESHREIIPVAMNPRPAILETIEQAQMPARSLVKINRQLDERMLQLNEEGFLNGHTPFSALLAFVSALTAALTGARDIALSNESSANEATIPGTNINHQYSKSYEFENDLREYLASFFREKINYFSFLRPLNELQIGKLFASMPQHHFSFKSCNRGSKDNVWCGECSKCLFTGLILAPFLDREKQHKIFGKDLLNDASLKPLFDQLTGIAAEKPFECVGTVNEVQTAIEVTRSHWEKPWPFLLNKAPDFGIKEDQKEQLTYKTGFTHYVPDVLYKIISQKLKQS